jgi:ADP-ribosylglycohydrolase
VLGSVYEAWSTKDKNFRLLHELDRPTDDSVLSLAVAKAILDADARGREPGFADYERELRTFGLRYPDAGYGGSFRTWMNNPRGKPYGSYGNGSAMRASALGWAFGDAETVLRQAELSAAPTHSHPEGVKGAQAVALAVFLARIGSAKEEIRAEISRRFGYDLDRTMDSIRPGYNFQVSCQASVPEALIAFLDSVDWEDAVRNAVSLGGDADTQACIAGAMAEAFYGGVPPRILAWVLPRLETVLFGILLDFARLFLPAPQTQAVVAEDAARTLPRGVAGKAPGRGRQRKNTGRPLLHPAPGYKVVLHGTAWNRIGDYARRLAQDPGIAGNRLRTALAELPVPRADPAWILVALLATKKPRIFAESEVAGDGSDWTREELGLLGDIGFAVPVTVFDDGRHHCPRVHPAPFGGTLLFAPGALLAASRGEPADSGVAPGGRIDRERYEALYERRILPLLHYASAVSAASGRKALVTVPGLGCGQFAGPFHGRIGAYLRDALAAILERHAASLLGIRAVRFDPYNECTNARMEFGSLSFLVRPLRVNEREGTELGLPQLCPPRDYEEAGDDFSGCDLFSFVAWDHVSWPGNDYWAGARSTDDGVKAAATDAMFALCGVRGMYDPEACAYLPPPGVRTWEDLVREHRITLRGMDNVMVVGN